MQLSLFVIEEHHEAFIIWINAVRSGLITLNNRLLHFDDHSDFRVPLFNTGINDLLNWNSQDQITFTEQELKIDTFIIPAIYLGIINDFVWIRNGMSKEADMQMYVRSYNDEGKKLIADKADKLSGDTSEAGIKQFRYRKLDTKSFADKATKEKFVKETTEQFPNNTTKSFADETTEEADAVLLDIDLDYFSCCQQPFSENEVIIEITEDEYKSFINNRYHPLGFITARIDAVEYEGNYYYVLNRFNDQYPDNRTVSTDEISQRIDNFINDLSIRAVQPSLITVCRSRFSGFTPNHQWEYIESKLLSGLHRLYDMEVKHIDAIYEKTVNNSSYDNA